MDICLNSINYYLQNRVNKYLLNKKMILKLRILVSNKYMFTFSKYLVSNTI